MLSSTHADSGATYATNGTTEAAELLLSRQAAGSVNCGDHERRGTERDGDQLGRGGRARGEAEPHAHTSCLKIVDEGPQKEHAHGE